VGFERTIKLFERAETSSALERAATVVSGITFILLIIVMSGLENLEYGRRDPSG
jgi:hypothetical protein